ncbi:protein ACCELERATED CELL DEATH 6-like isoform X1 [Nicotiana sylvestris]|uniref:Ankyrin repeat-containing protein At5g02620-like n=1 Tax=Nicotiana sylvestris TaxID=4096 RepID=A0A1U7WUY2_NICSY|nr:PREDICTED: ankyrin repeat-containing protein At5g02620-like [Nicotiana sylvestris]XP_009781117.1 PREDICTED: ankyrin repeat-containing protein At5g02620-like [Nicotiana sylvestris]
MLLSIGGEENKEILMRMTDDNGDTALHKAVRSRHQDVARLLVKEDPEFEYPSNKARETPLYLAAESGLRDALVEILVTCNKPTFAAGPFNRTPLHAAVIHQHTDCARLLWQWNKSLCEEADVSGWNSLHYAVYLGLKEVVSDMLGWKKSLAYLPAGSENRWTTTFHIAANAGDVNMINELLKYRPDCWEMLDSRDKNALHVAILNNQFMLVKSLLKSTKWDSLADNADDDGNTPLHLLAASSYWAHVPVKLRENRRAKTMSFNKENQTPLDVAWSCIKRTTNKESISGSLYHDFANIGRFGRRETPWNTLDEIHIQREFSKRDKEFETEIKSIMSAAQIHLVMATLLVTVTFAAGFTLPGGFDCDSNSPNKGMAILTRKAAFHVFVITDAIAFACSAGAIFSYFLMAINHRPTSYQDYRILSALSRVAGQLQLLAMLAVVIAFVTGMYATLAYSLGLAITVCTIGCLSFLLYMFVMYIVGRELV